MSKKSAPDTPTAMPMVVPSAPPPPALLVDCASTSLITTNNDNGVLIGGGAPLPPLRARADQRSGSGILDRRLSHRAASASRCFRAPRLTMSLFAPDFIAHLARRARSRWRRTWLPRLQSALCKPLQVLPMRTTRLLWQLLEHELGRELGGTVRAHYSRRHLAHSPSTTTTTITTKAKHKGRQLSPHLHFRWAQRF
jgi:hypothetical protein